MLLPQEIVKEAKAEAKAIVKEAEKEKEGSLKELEKELKKREEKELSSYEERLKERVVEETSKARLEAKRVVEKAKEELFAKALEEAVESFLNSAAYRDYLASSIEEGKRELGNDVVVHLNKEDQELISVDGIVYDLDDRGVVVESKDGKFVLDFSLSELLERKADSLKAAFFKEVNL
ncbi:MAG: hypothetical protein D6769_02710 [Methanobacteriota archaeon]|nr:MAG: hypothetical protein D6769_02710 [Euryarchaeota archaeon]